MDGKYIFILGCNRSGTTLLQNVFRCTKNSEVIDGETSPMALMYYKDKISDGTNIVLKRAMGAGAGFFRIPLVSKEVMFDNSAAWVDWLTDWQKVYFIHIRRDPRDSLVSKMKKSTYVSNFRMWKNAESIYEKLSKISEKVFLVKYEELALNTNEVMEDICEKIGLDVVCDFTLWHEQLSEKSVKHESMNWMNGPRTVDGRSIGRWKEDTQRIKDAIQTCPDFINKVVEYGYDVEGWENLLDA